MVFKVTNSTQTQTIPKQIRTQDIKTMKALTTGVHFVLVTSITSTFLLNFLLAVSLQLVIGMISMLQLIVFNTVLSIEFPSNAQLINLIIIQILNVDVIDPEYV